MEMIGGVYVPDDGIYDLIEKKGVSHEHPVRTVGSSAPSSAQPVTHGAQQ
jgi:hypothetical protein